MPIPAIAPGKKGAWSIAAVERETGLAKDTLRVWERRYGFPAPLRDAFDERLYPQAQVEKLKVIRRLMARGHRPGKVVPLDIDALQRLAAEADADAPEPQPAPAVAAALDLLATHRIGDLRRAFGQAISRDGLGRFVLEIAAPMACAVGERWMRGALAVFEEHLFTESLTAALRNAIAGVPQSAAGPRILMTTFPDEQHGLGLLMAEAMLALEGAHCVSLGVETPIGDIPRAAAAQDADIVALSFSLAYPVPQAVAGLTELRRGLDTRIEVWVGGGSTMLARRLPEGVVATRELATIGAAVLRWRAAR